MRFLLFTSLLWLLPHWDSGSEARAAQENLGALSAQLQEHAGARLREISILCDIEICEDSKGRQLLLDISALQLGETLHPEVILKSWKRLW